MLVPARLNLVPVGRRAPDAEVNTASEGPAAAAKKERYTGTWKGQAVAFARGGAVTAQTKRPFVGLSALGSPIGLLAQSQRRWAGTSAPLTRRVPDKW
jgi:hypothetical protein